MEQGSHPVDGAHRLFGGPAPEPARGRDVDLPAHLVLRQPPDGRSTSS
jgi:hypothetical protein